MPSLTDYIIPEVKPISSPIVKRERSSEEQKIEADARKFEEAETAQQIKAGEIDVEAEEEQTRRDADAADREAAFEREIDFTPRESAFEDSLDFAFESWQKEPF